MRPTSELRTSPAAAIECVFLGTQGAGRNLPELGAGLGVRITTAGSADEARVLLALLTARVLLARWDPLDAGSLAAIHGITNYGREAQWVAWLPVFDSKEWVQCLENGAFDLVTASATAEEVASVLRRAAAQHERLPRERRERRSLRRLFRFGDLLIFRKH